MAKTFSDLKIDELRAVAEAFAVDSEGGKPVIIAALAESGVTWDQYQNMFFPEVKEETVVPEVVETIEVVDSSPVITPDVVDVDKAALLARLAELEDKLAAAESNAVVVSDKPDFTSNQKWLIKMTRKNPLFEIAGYRFTQEHPYALVDANRVEEVLGEDGFRQAKPSEIEEFYS